MAFGPLPGGNSGKRRTLAAYAGYLLYRHLATIDAQGARLLTTAANQERNVTLLQNSSAPFL